MVRPNAYPLILLFTMSIRAEDPETPTSQALLTEAVAQKEAQADHLAYLTDRVLVAEGQPQRYGTQFYTDKGELKPRPIEDEANVDARRKEVGLPPLAEYARQLRELERP